MLHIVMVNFFKGEKCKDRASEQPGWYRHVPQPGDLNLITKTYMVEVEN